MHKTILPFLVLGLTLAIGADAQTVGQPENTLTNKDVVALARAGYSEDFLLDLIGMSRTRFDTSANGLAELAKQGLTERLIRAMLNPLEVSSQTPAGLTAPERATATVSVAAHSPGLNRKGHVPKTNEKTTALTLAVANQASYYHSTSVMWGLLQSKTGVGSKAAAEPNIASPLLAVYGKGGR